MRRTTDDDEVIRKRSAWLIPLGIVLIVAALSAVILLIYLAPTAPNLFEEQVTPTAGTDAVKLRVHGRTFRIPANYLQYETARQGGDRHEVALYALFPEMTGWSSWEAQAFTGNSPESQVIFLIIHDENYVMSEEQRLKRVYMAYTRNPRGTRGPFGLRQFEFREDSGYQRDDLFVGDSPAGPVVMRCERVSVENPSPNCLRDTEIAPNVALSYRFKRANLSRWQEIADGVAKLVASFRPAQK